MTPAHSFTTALASGFIGATALTLLHETVRQHATDAPRVDLLGMRAIAKSLRAIDQPVPDPHTLHRSALVGDLLSNGLYYSAVGLADADDALPLGIALGLAAGIGAVVLPGPLGLGDGPSNRTPATVAMTIGWYLVGGLVAGGVRRIFAK